VRVVALGEHAIEWAVSIEAVDASGTGGEVHGQYGRMERCKSKFQVADKREQKEKIKMKRVKLKKYGWMIISALSRGRQGENLVKKIHREGKRERQALRVFIYLFFHESCSLGLLHSQNNDSFISQLHVFEIISSTKKKKKLNHRTLNKVHIFY
jgi:hypothetical protein